MHASAIRNPSKVDQKTKNDPKSLNKSVRQVPLKFSTRTPEAEGKRSSTDNLQKVEVGLNLSRRGSEDGRG